MEGQSIQSRGFRPDFLWRNDLVVLTFHSQIPLFSAEGISNGKAILDQLNLNEQLPKLNSFLRENNKDYTLSFFEREDVPRASTEQTLHAQSDATDFSPPPGVFLFDVSKRRIKQFFSAFDTNVVAFFKFAHNQGAEVTQDTGLNSPGGINPEAHFVADFVNLINNDKSMQTLIGAQIPISAASPDWAAGATPSQSQGCPITPPIPVEDACSLWSIQFPQGLIPQELNSLNGEGVTVFILDALPERKAISDAAAAAAAVDANQLLVDVDSTVTFNYDFSPPLITGSDSEPVSVGKDVFGHHSIMKMPDHGLFVAGIVHDVAPGAQIECIRVLDEYCVGDTEALINALNYIASRMVDGGDLHGQPVVINTSLILPQEKYAQALGLNVDTTASDTAAYAAVLSAVQNVTGNNAILVGSAGNDADIRNNPNSLRHGALYPAGFANDPYDITGVIPVGAVDANGKPTSYSGYPGPHGVATFGGEVPVVTTSPTDGSVTVDASQAVRGIYSATTYPPLVAGGPSEPDPNTNGWAYWVGTSFATPIISGLTARVLQQAAQQAVTANVRDSLIAIAGSNTVNWDRLDSASTGVTTPTIAGPVIQATQVCVSGDTGE